MIGMTMDLMKRAAGIMLLVLIIVSPLVVVKQLYAQTTVTPTVTAPAASVGGGKCPGGYVNAILLVNMSIDRLLAVAYQRNISLDKQLIERARIIYNLSSDMIASMDSEGCKKLYGDLVDTLRDLAARVGIELKPEAKGVYERAILMAAQRALNISMALNLTTVATEIEVKVKSGNVSMRDLEEWEVKIRGKEASIKIHVMVTIVRASAMEGTLIPGNESEGLKMLSIAEEVLSRVKDLLISVNASPSAIQAIDRAILNVREAKSVLEGRKDLPSARKLEMVIGELENRVRIFNLTLNTVKIPNETLTKIKDLLNETLRKIDEAKNALSRGDLSYAEKMFREAYKIFREAEELFERAVKTGAKKPEELGELMEELEELAEKLTRLEREYNLTVASIKTQNQSVRELIERIQRDIEQTHQLIINVTELIKEEKAGDARVLMNRVKAMIENIERNIELLKKLAERSGEEPSRLREELSEILMKASELRNKFEELVRRASNTTDQRIRAQIDMIQRMLSELNSTIANITMLIDIGRYNEAQAAIEKAKHLIDAIERAIENLSKILEESGRRGR
ncbi:predicted laminin subunit beta-1 [Desulfurococcaceae archaeon AG1]|nr:predicted laminin subunit beta-1 [Desulfurococcaceae archaeon AG1]